MLQVCSGLVCGQYSGYEIQRNNQDFWYVSPECPTQKYKFLLANAYRLVSSSFFTCCRAARYEINGAVTAGKANFVLKFNFYGYRT